MIDEIEEAGIGTGIAQRTGNALARLEAGFVAVI